LNVLVLTNMYPTESTPHWGAFVREQVESLRRLGVTVDVLAIDGPRGGAKYLRAPRSLRQALSSSDFDLIHAHYGLSGAVALAQRRVPIVTTFHGGDTGYVRWQRSVSWVVARLTTPIFVTEDGAEALGITGADVIPCGVDLERFQPLDRREARRRLGWDEDAVYVLLPGSVHDPVKNADLFHAAVNCLAARRGNVRAASLERVSRDEVALIMNAADVTLLTSLSEGSPVAIKESLACCTPIVSVSVGDVPHLVDGLPGCLIERRDARALADALEVALATGREPGLRERVSTYGNDRIAERLFVVYERVASRTAG
jgi:glycosyltransferase involved in cell wall biosynthesis